MIRSKAVQLKPGFLGIEESRGIVFFISKEHEMMLPVILLAQRVLYGTFCIPCTVVVLDAPSEQLNGEREQDIKNRSGFFRAIGANDLMGIYINMRDCHQETIQFTEGLSMRTLHLQIDDQASDVEGITRTAIVGALKAIRH